MPVKPDRTPLSRFGREELGGRALHRNEVDPLAVRLPVELLHALQLQRFHHMSLGVVRYRQGRIFGNLKMAIQVFIII